MTRKNFRKSLKNTFKECLKISHKKNKDYAINEDPFKNFRASEVVGVPIARAILVRMTDKMSRISNLLDKENSVKDEKIEDSIYDLINYAAILRAWLKN